MANVYLEQAGEFFRRFFRMGGTIAMLKKLLTDDALMERWIKNLTEQPEFKLVHGVYNPVADVLDAFKSRCATEGIDFDKFRWIGTEQAPDFDLKDPETVVVLDATLDTLQATFEFAWAWAVEGQEDSWRWEGMLSDPGKLRLLLVRQRQRQPRRPGLPGVLVNGKERLRALLLLSKGLDPSSQHLARLMQAGFNVEILTV